MNEAPRINWQDYFMTVALCVAQRSPDIRKVGAVLVHTPTKRIISTGYNGTPPGIDASSINWKNREEVYQHVVHAEANCLLYAGSSFSDTVLYCTKSPCRNCAILISAAKVSAVYYFEPYRDIHEVEAFLSKTGIECRRYLSDKESLLKLADTFPTDFTEWSNHNGP